MELERRVLISGGGGGGGGGGAVQREEVVLVRPRLVPCASSSESMKGKNQLNFYFGDRYICILKQWFERGTRE